jgi:myo-inositol catabolism protein IolC
MERIRKRSYDDKLSMPATPQLLILPFDHRSSFSRDLLGYEGALSKKQHRDVVKLKEIVFAGFEKAIAKEKNRGEFGILLDEEYGLTLLRKAKKLGVQICLTTEKSGQEEYQFEYGTDFAAHINKIAPQYVKALVRYNPANQALNKRQLARLKKLADFCHRNGYQLLFELLVPPTEADLKRVKTKEAFDAKLRATLTIQAIKEIQETVDVDIWKLEGFTKAEWGKVVKTIKPTARIIVLGRGADKKQVEQWLVDGAAYDSIIGFAVGRTIFYEPLKKFIAGKLSREAVAASIGRNFGSFVRLWRKSKK